jgi:hypothetical protein
MQGIEKKSAELTAKQTRTIEALLKEPTTDAAARAAKVSVTTIWRWLNDPIFSAAYRQARGQLLESTLTKLQAASGDAVETLRAVMNDAEANHGAKVSAARAVLEFSLKAREVLEVEQRLSDLESRLAAQDGQQKGKANWR